LPEADLDLEKFSLLMPLKLAADRKRASPRGGAKNTEKKCFRPAADTLEGTKRLILAAIRVWELKRGRA
jgi:hypothetical protein